MLVQSILHNKFQLMHHSTLAASYPQLLICNFNSKIGQTYQPQPSQQFLSMLNYVLIPKDKLQIQLALPTRLPMRFYIYLQLPNYTVTRCLLTSLPLFHNLAIFTPLLPPKIPIFWSGNLIKLPFTRMDQPLLEPKTSDSLRRRVWLETKKLWTTAFPTMVARVGFFGVLVVTQAFIGQISELNLAAYALVQTITVRFTNGILLGMSSVTETLCGQAFGAKQYHMLGIYLQRAWVINFVTAVLMLPIYAFGTPIFRLLGQQEDISVAAGKISLWFIPLLFYSVFSNTNQMFLQGQLKNMIVGWLAAFSFVFHVLLSWLFVSKWNWGITGALAAMNISCWLMMIGQLVYIIGGWCPLTWFGFTTSAFSDLMPVIKMSISSGVMLCLELWYNAILVLLAGYMKNAENAISAFSICLNINSWIFRMSLGFLSAACVRVSNELGRGDAKAAKFSIVVISCNSLIVGTFFFIICLAFGDEVSYLFTSNAEIAKTVSNLSVLLTFSILLNSIQPVLSGMCRDRFWNVNIASYYVIGVPAGMLLGYMTTLQVKGIWIGMMGGVAIQSLILGFITWRTDWDRQVSNASKRLNKWLLKPSESSNAEQEL